MQTGSGETTYDYVALLFVLVLSLPRSYTANKNRLSWSYPGKDHMVLQGHWKGDSIHVRMKIYDLNGYLLKHRCFHWINVYPYNR